MAAVRAKLPFSERRACRLLGVSRTVLHYAPVKRDEVLQRRLVDLAGERRRFGYRRLHILLEREGFFVNHKRVHRLYRKAGLAVRKRKKRYRVAVDRQPLQMPSGPLVDGLCLRRAVQRPADQMSDGGRRLHQGGG